ncbi:hypothetical protein E2C01_061007 [Portunus trituberculatus]|uniref:Uncharacterized protein n=1 Tax=Portunus trituberculatus TaxID=210409 RepID=A0A5B7H700_PORTR|nr:hypothetical protein [Portunus trituberculatus]
MKAEDAATTTTITTITARPSFVALSGLSLLSVSFRCLSVPPFAREDTSAPHSGPATPRRMH